MELTVTTTRAHTPTLRERIRILFGGAPDDGQLRPTVNAVRALALVKDGATLVDVRESSEWKSGHAPQAVHIPLDQIDQRARRLQKNRPVVVVCASGMRSNTAAKKLRNLGYEATSISGGMGAWQRAGGSVRR